MQNSSQALTAVSFTRRSSRSSLSSRFHRALCAINRPLVLLSTIVAALTTSALTPTALADHSVAREWNDTMLSSIKVDLVRPPVQARNLFHVSVAMYDAWAAYDATVQGYFFGEKHNVTNIEAARHEAISYAAFRVMKHRFALSPNVIVINGLLDARLIALGYSPAITTTVGSTPAAVGNRVAAMVIAQGLTDNAHEEVNYAKYPNTYPDVNPSLVVGLPFNPNVVDVTRYQPLSLTYFVDQGGNVIPGGFPPKLAPFWGFVTPFGLLPSDMDPARGGVYLNAAPPPVLNGVGDATWRASHEGVIALSATLTPDDGVMINISPSVMGNNPIGTNDGAGRRKNPVTGKPYAANFVKRGDWSRCLAEFWADGPNSTTPPGHWNELANVVSDHPAFERRLGGKGPTLDELEWDVKVYLALNGALHDAAVTAWGIKGYYDTMRPIGAIRTMAQNGQCSDPKQPSYDPNGLHLVADVCELITAATTAVGERHEELAGYEGEIAVKSWPGAPLDPANQYSGVRWMLGGSWVPYQRPTFVTPPFAGYVSGHSTYSRAAAEMLARLTGTEYFPGGVGEFTCTQSQMLVFEDGPSETFTFQWATYYDAADQSGLSRLVGGIHPSFDDFEGRILGERVAQRAHAKALALFEPLVIPCDADFDGDGAVGASDLSMVLASWGQRKSPYDLTGDGAVNASDLSLLLSQWGACP